MRTRRYVSPYCLAVFAAGCVPAFEFSPPGSGTGGEGGGTTGGATSTSTTGAAATAGNGDATATDDSTNETGLNDSGEATTEAITTTTSTSSTTADDSADASTTAMLTSDTTASDTGPEPCQAGFEDCDGDAATGVGGCEADLSRDATCGACGKNCGDSVGFVCIAGGLCSGSFSVPLEEGYVASAFPMSNYEMAPSIILDGSPQFLGYIQPEDWGAALPGGIPMTGATVVDANLRVYNHAFEDSMTFVHVQQVTSAWDPAFVTYDTRPSVTGANVDTEKVGVGWHAFDVTPIVGSWFSGAAAHGFQLHTLDNNSSHWYTAASPMGTGFAPALDVEVTY